MRAMTMIQHIRFVSILGCLLLGTATARAQGAADVVVLHGRIFTENPEEPWAQAVAIRDSKIEAVGTDAEISRYQGVQTKILDAEGHLVLPGFEDAHVHFLGGSEALQEVELDKAQTVAEIQKQVKDFADAHPDKKVIRGWGWMYPVFGKVALPNKEILDAVVPDRPVILTSYDWHTTWANSKALEMAGITKSTPNPRNGIIVRDPRTGNPTGTLKEDAGALVMKLVPPESREEQIQDILAGIKLMNSFGITRVDSAGGDAPHIDLFAEIRKRHELTLRFYFALICEPPTVTPAFIAQAEAIRAKYHDEWLSGGAIKFFADGVIEAHTAAMLAPYTDDPSTSGHLKWEPANYKRGVAELDQRHFQIFTHAIGDRAIRMALDGYEAAQAANQREDARDRIEHIEDPDPADIPRFGVLGVIASMQPLHAYPNDDVLDVWARNVGPIRAQHAWPWRDLVTTGASLAFGSDWPVVTPDPWQGIQTLLTRETLEGTPAGGWDPKEKVGLEMAIYGYTLGAARAGFFDKTEGSIQAGKWADMIVLSQDLFKIPPIQIHNTKVLYTMVGGKIVYQSPEAR
jgi:hypothetical protein